MTRKIQISTPKGEATLELKSDGTAVLRRFGTSTIGDETAWLLVSLLDRIEALEAIVSGFTTTTALPDAEPVAEAASTPADEPTMGFTNVNTAKQTELEALKGIGRSTAKSIIANRPYADAAELQSKLELSDQVMDGIKSSISF